MLSPEDEAGLLEEHAESTSSPSVVASPVATENATAPSQPKPEAGRSILGVRCESDGLVRLCTSPSSLVCTHAAGVAQSLARSANSLLASEDVNSLRRRGGIMVPCQRQGQRSGALRGQSAGSSPNAQPRSIIGFPSFEQGQLASTRESEASVAVPLLGDPGRPGHSEWPRAPISQVSQALAGSAQPRDTPSHLHHQGSDRLLPSPLAYPDAPSLTGQRPEADAPGDRCLAYAHARPYKTPSGNLVPATSARLSAVVQRVDGDDASAASSLEAAKLPSPGEVDSAGASVVWTGPAQPAAPPPDSSAGLSQRQAPGAETPSLSLRRQRLARAPVTQAIHDAALGAVNMIIALPVTIAFTAILYPQPFFLPFRPALSRLMSGSNAMHQLAICVFSTLPYAVGQVQDLGLILMGAMTSDIYRQMSDEPDAKIVATAIVASSLATALLGLCLFGAGRTHLAGLVSYIPLPVVAGYLAYVGYFCVAAGIGQATGLTINTPMTWLQLLSHPDAWSKLAVTLAASSLIACTLRFWKSAAALPAVMVLLPALWFTVLGLAVATTGMSWASLQEWLVDHEWISEPPPPGASQSVAEVYKLYNLLPFASSKIGWNAIVRQAPTLLAICIVCTFGVSMDIMAVQAQLPFEIDADREMASVGIANVAAGICTGGGTGSLIFSQCLLAMRAGVKTRVQGATLAALQMLYLLLPVSSAVHYLANWYFGSLLLVIGLDIMYEWLVATYMRVKKAEFVLSWTSFATTLILTTVMPVQGLEVSMVVGIVLCALHFTYEYSVMQLVTFTVSPSHSNSMLPYRHQQVLALFRGNLRAVSISGYIFFGSMVEIGKRVRECAAVLTPLCSIDDILGDTGLEDEVAVKQRAARAVAMARRFILLDLRHVTGLDATTASAFSMLRRALHARNVTLVLTGVFAHDAVWRMLVANKVVPRDGAWEASEACPAFASMDAAIHWCEEHFTEVAILHELMEDLSKHELTIKEVLLSHLGNSAALAAATSRVPLNALSEHMESFMDREALCAGDVLFEQGTPSDSVFVLLSGSVVSIIDFLQMSSVPEDSLSSMPRPHRPVQLPGLSDRTFQAGDEATVQMNRSGRVRLIHSGPASVVGSLDFTLQRPRSFLAIATRDTVVMRLQRAQHEGMARDHPHANSILQQIMLKSSFTATAQALTALERAIS